MVAKDFGKQHSHVLRDIENIISNMVDEFGNPKLDRQMFIESTYENRGKQYKEYLLTRDGFSLLVMGFTGKEALQQVTSSYTIADLIAYVLKVRRW